MMAAGCKDTEIQAALRWASEDALLLYKRTEADAYGAWLLGAERVHLTARMTHHMPRPMPRYENDAVAATFITARVDIDSAADAADRNDAAAAARDER